MERYELPKGWQWRKIGSVCKIVSGSTPKTNIPEYWNGNILWATPKDLGKLQTVEIDYTERTITQAGLESCSAQLLPIGSVLLTSRAPIGHLAINTKPMCTNQGFKNLVPGTEIYNRYLYWTLKFFVKELQHIGRGCTFEEISKSLLSSFEIPVPPLAEQKRIVARIEELTRRVEEVRGLRREAVAEIEQFIQESIGKLLTGLTQSFMPLKQILIEKPRNGWSPPGNSFASHGVPVLTLSAVTGFKYDSSKIKWTSSPTRKDAHYWLKPGELLITRSNTLELVGHAAIYDGSPAPCICPDLIMKMTVDPKKADVRFIHFWLQTHTVRKYLMTQARGTSGSMKKINQGHVENIPVPDIPIHKQHLIVEYLNCLQAKADELKRLQAETEAELAAFTPALLAKAFRGEL